MKRKRYLKYIFVTILSIGAFIAFLLSPLFNFKTINVVGTEYYQPEEIQESLAHLKNKNYFIALFDNTPFSHLDYLFKGQLYDSEQQLIFDKPYLKTAEISFSFPGIAKVEVEERLPAFFTRNGEEYLLIDSEGVVLEAFSAEEKPDFPVVEGVETSGYRVGNALVGMGTDSQLELAIKICKGMEQIEFSEGFIDIVDVSDTDRIWMFVKPSLSICIGDEEDLSVKLSVLKEILASGYDGNSDGIIDFTNGKNPIFKKNQDSMGTDPGGEDIVSGNTEINDSFLDESVLRQE